MRLITLALATLLLLIQFPLLRSWKRVDELDNRVAAVHKKNDVLKARNAKLDSEVRDLKDGTGAVEERARYELGMIKQNEVFVQVVGSNGKPVAPPPAARPSAPAATH
ncbi:MAG: cell division protein FtsB [Pseudomonadota bacterium]